MTPAMADTTRVTGTGRALLVRLPRTRAPWRVTRLPPLSTAPALSSVSAMRSWETWVADCSVLSTPDCTAAGMAGSAYRPALVDSDRAPASGATASAGWASLALVGDTGGTTAGPVGLGGAADGLVRGRWATDGLVRVTGGATDGLVRDTGGVTDGLVRDTGGATDGLVRGTGGDGRPGEGTGGATDGLVRDTGGTTAWGR